MPKNVTKNKVKNTKNNNEIKVVELFAGVGGFRLGLENASPKFKTVWANQWEPGSTAQHAADVYKQHWNDGTLVNEDITKVWHHVPEHDLLVGGFPCQDYSVAHGNKAQGIKGKKGVLWWEIHKIVESKKPKYILLENVDRLLKSPSIQRGRDFAIMLRALNDLGYVVEWMNINAADYGFPQKRRRVYIYAHKSEVAVIPTLDYLRLNSIFSRTFAIDTYFSFKTDDVSKNNYVDLADLTDNFGDGKFNDIGISINGHVFSSQFKAVVEEQKPLREIILKTGDFIFLNDSQIEKASYMKENKRIPRIKDGFEYMYSEGKMSFPENMDVPGRTMLTSEGTINRSSHFIGHKGKIRFLTPVEAERLNGFPDNWTAIKNDRFRYFAMGNALVVGIIEKIGKEIIKSYGK